jgi:hypothetical protein
MDGYAKEIWLLHHMLEKIKRMGKSRDLGSDLEKTIGDVAREETIELGSSVSR